jgi:hypothetical protein
MQLWLIPLRSLVPCLTIVVLVGTLWWGPWVSLFLALGIHTVMGTRG